MPSVVKLFKTIFSICVSMLISLILIFTACSNGKWKIKYLLGSRTATKLWSSWNWKFYSCKVRIFLCPLITRYHIVFLRFLFKLLNSKWNGMARYEDKRWIPRNTTSRTPSKVSEERMYESRQRNEDGVEHRRSTGMGSPEEHNKLPPPTITKVIPVAPKVTTQLTIFLHSKSWIQKLIF